MRAYDDLTPVAIESGGIPYTYFRSERRCPSCKHALSTDGRGEFICPGCGYADYQDVERLRKAGLNYHHYHRRRSAMFLPAKRWTL